MVFISWFNVIVILSYKEHIKKACQSELVEDACAEAYPPWFDGLTMTPCFIFNNAISSLSFGETSLFWIAG
jgi:hypothetical protein